MTIAIDFVGTNRGSGAKTYNINFCNELSSMQLSQNIKIFICKSHLKQISGAINNDNQKIQYIIKPNFLSIALFKLIWMQFIFPFEMKLLGVKKVYCPLNFAPIIAKFLKIKTILCVHSNLTWVYFELMPNSKFRNFILKKFMEISIKSCHLLIVDSFFAKEEIIKLLHLYKKKIEVVYLGINNTFFLKERKKKLKLGFDYDNKYILSVLSCARHHNIINLLKAYKMLVKELSFELKIVLVLQILDKNYFVEIKEYIRTNFAKNEVLIFPNLDSHLLPDLYKNSELYVFTSYCEVFGLTSLEAMSQQVPVVISNKSALPEINGDAAVYFDPDDLDQTKDSLKKVLIDKSLKQKLINNGNAQLKKFNSKESIAKTIRIIENIT
jgi:glycosyltransferase involved in cell wall biosynthesis